MDAFPKLVSCCRLRRDLPGADRPHDAWVRQCAEVKHMTKAPVGPICAASTTTRSRMPQIAPQPRPSGRRIDRVVTGSGSARPIWCYTRPVEVVERLADLPIADREMILAATGAAPQGLNAPLRSTAILSKGEDGRKRAAKNRAATAAKAQYGDILYRGEGSVALADDQPPRPVLKAFREQTLDEIIDARQIDREDPTIALCRDQRGAGDKSFSRAAISTR